jgi:hypothetical protein
LGYTAAAALRYGLGLLSWWLRMMSDPALHPFSDQVFRRPRGEVVDAWADELWPFLLGLAEEARGLLHAGA